MQLTDERHARSTRTITVLSAALALAGVTLVPVLPTQALSGADFYATLDLDRPELADVKAEVDQGDYAGADQELQDFYAGRSQPLYTTFTGDSGDVPTAEDITNGIFEFEGGQVRDYYDDQAGRIDIDWDDDWGEYEDPPVNALSLMNRFIFYNDLIRAYLALSPTDPLRDEIAAAWMEIALDFIDDKGDVPIGAAPHNRLTEGIRLRGWLDAFSVFKDSDAVAASDLVAYVDYMRQSADDIQRNMDNHKGNNWYVSLARSLYLAALYLPEFNDASLWRFKAMSAADRYVDRNMRSDGLSYEPALNYHNYSLSLLATIYEFGELNGESPFTEAELSYLQLQAESMAAVTMPDFTVPLFGDSRNADLDMSGVATFADVFERDDLEWVATDGASGQQPTWGSMLFPESYAVLRSGWDPDDQYMFVGNQDTNYNASHRHPDDLGVVAYAFGRPLVVDSGVYDYSDSDHANWLRRTTEAHNTVEVGGEPQPKTTQAVPSARRALEWYSNDGFDFYRGDHEDYQPIIHNRSVFSPKPGFWVVSDVLDGSPGSESYRQLWHFPADAPVSINGGTEAVTAGFGSVPGVVVAPVDPGETSTTLHEDGYLADGHGNLYDDVDYVSFDQTTSGTATFDTLLYPGDDGTAPSVGVSRISLPVAADVATAMQLSLPGSATGVYYLSHEANPGTRSVGSYDFDGRLFYIEEDSGGDVTRLALAAGTTLEEGGTTLVSSTTQVNDLSVEYDGSQLIVSTGEPLEGDLTVYAPGVTDVVLNGAAATFTDVGDDITIDPPDIVTGQTLLDEPFGAIRDGGTRKWRFVDNDDEHWEVAKGDWSVTQDGGQWLYSQTTNTSIDGQAYVPGPLDDVSVTTDVHRGTTSASTHGYGVMLRYQDDNNHYKLRLYKSSGTVKAEILAKVDGTQTVLVSNPVGYTMADSHDLVGTIHDDRISFTIDGTEVATATDSQLTAGGIGLWAHRTEASFGDVELDAATVWDFDDATAEGWRGLNGDWDAVQDVYRQTDQNQNTGMAILEYDTNDVNYSATIDRGQIGSSAYGYGLAARMADNRTYYMARIYHTSQGTWAQLYMVVGGDRTNFYTGNGVPLSLDPAEPHHLRFRVTGDQLSFWIDGNLKATAIDGTLPTGGVGMQAHNAVASFDDVKIAELTDPKSWTASRGHFADISESLKTNSIGVERSRLNVAETLLWEDYVTEATFLPQDWSGAGELGLAVRATKDTLGYRAVLVDTGSGKFARIERYTGGSRATEDPVVIAQEPVNFSKTGQLPLEVVVRGSTIELWLDGTLEVSATDTVIGRGGVSIIGSGVDANVTNVLVTELVED